MFYVKCKEDTIEDANPRRVDILIIGGGVIGVTAAYFLAGQGRQVVLLEKGDISSGSSFGNAGIVAPSHSIPLAAPGVIGKGLKWMFNRESPFYIKPRLDLSLLSWLWKFRQACRMDRVREAIPLIREMAVESVNLYHMFSQQEDMDFGFEQRGLLMLCRTGAGLKEAVEEARLVEAYGVQSNVLDAEAVRRMDAHVKHTVIGGVFYPGDTHLVPDQFVREVARLAAEHGVEIKTDTEVTGFDFEGRKISQVYTTHGSFQPGEVVLAAGAWSPGIIGGLGIKLPIQAAKGYSITVKRPETAPQIPIILYEDKVAVTPMGDKLRFGGTLEMAGMDLSINQRRVDAILRHARHCHDAADEVEIEGVWRGLRPCTPDGLPVVGRVTRHENLVIAAGHAMIGMSIGPATGKLVMQILTGETPMIDISKLCLSRF